MSSIASSLLHSYSFKIKLYYCSFSIKLYYSLYMYVYCIDIYTNTPPPLPPHHLNSNSFS
jgi:hypothetical protein